MTKRLALQLRRWSQIRNPLEGSWNDGKKPHIIPAFAEKNKMQRSIPGADAKE